jgi:hypothetical protein
MKAAGSSPATSAIFEDVMSEDYNRLSRAASFLELLAARLDRWASETSSGGWSTQHLTEQVMTAHQCRAEAQRLRVHAEHTHKYAVDNDDSRGV